MRTLTTFGEWFHNTGTGKFYMYFGSVAPTSKTVQVATINYLLTDVNYDYITVNNLNFSGSIDNSINFTNGNDNCIVQNSKVSFAGKAGICFSTGSGNIVNNNVVDHCNRRGISSDGTSTQILNNNVSVIGTIGGQFLGSDGYTGITVLGNGAIVRYNNIHNIGGSGVSVKYTGIATIQYNFIDTVCTILDDGAGIYTSTPNTSPRLIDHNIVLNVVGNSEGTDNTTPLSSGIFLDETATNVTVSNNTMAHVPYDGLKLHKANNNTITDNTTFDNTAGVYFQNTTSTSFINNKMRRNIFFAKTANQLSMQFYSTIDNLTDLTADSNYYVRPLDDNLTINVQQPSTKYMWAGKTINTWQTFSGGQDMHSKKSPKTITDVNQLNFQYNASSSAKTISFSGLSYVDARGKVYNNSATIPAWSSLVLIANGTTAADAAAGLLPAVNPANTVNGLDYKYYEGSWTVLPTFTSLTAVKAGAATSLDLTLANRATLYGFSFSGYINVPADGQYTFYTSSDDGSNLYIDNNLVVSNDGIHAPIEKSGTIGLKAGKHAISVLFFQQAGGGVFNVSYAGTGISKQAIPASALYRVSTTGGRIANSLSLNARSLTAAIDTKLDNPLQVTAYPNPSITEFGLSVAGGSNEKIQVLVTDMAGRKMYETSGTTNTTYRFGNSFIPGIYIIRVIQGNTIQTKKVLKG